jgi:flagellar biosynthetic protein FliQ
MTPEAATTLIANALRITFMAAGPILAAALVAGLLVGVVQTVLQVNEASVSFVVKVVAVTGVLVVVGPALGTQMMDYTRNSLQSIALVVKR